MRVKTMLKEKMREGIAAVAPIALIVVILCFTVTPVSAGLMLSFLIGTVMVICGLGLFTFGAENSMTLIGSSIGAKLTSSGRLWLILAVSFLLGVIITVAEPDLQVLAGNVPHINTAVLILTVAVGVGFFLMVAMLRILLGVPVRWILLLCYIVVFVLAYFSDPAYLSVAFDAGGVPTGPMTGPFIMALGVGVASIRSDKNAEADSFGLVALCSVGPVLAVMILGFFYSGDTAELSAVSTAVYENTAELGKSYLFAIPEYIAEVSLALAPIVLFFLIFQVLSLRLAKKPFHRILVGLCFTFAGLVLFLTGVNVGFSSLGAILGGALSAGASSFLPIPVAVLMGWFIVRAEPAIHVLTKQVEEISAGAVSGKALRVSLSVAIAAAMGLAMARVFYGIHIFWFLIPGYAVSLILSFFVPPLFTSIAFDSGGVASGPMTATFMLPFAMGACEAVGGNILTDAFGLVALVAMMPLITIQIMGLICVLKTRREEKKTTETLLGDTEIIELWEV